MPIERPFGNFAQDLIGVLQITQALKRAQQDQERQARLDAQAEEDRKWERENRDYQRTRQQQQDERQSRMDTLNEQDKYLDLIMKGGHPVSGGQVSDTARLPMSVQRPDPLAGLLGDSQGGGILDRMIPMDTPVQRPADTGRSVELAGRMLEMPTPDEALARQFEYDDARAGRASQRGLDQLRAELGLRDEVSHNARQRDLAEAGIDVDMGGGRTVRVLPSEADDLIRATTAAKDKGEANVRVNSDMVKELDVDPEMRVPVQQYVQMLGEVRQVRADRSGGGGLTPYQQYQVGRNERSDREGAYNSQKTRAQTLQRQLDDLQGQEDAKWSEVAGWEAEVKALESSLGEMNTSDQIKTKANMNALRSKIQANRTLIDSLQRRKNDVDKRRKEAIEQYAPGTQEQVREPAASQYQPGQSVKLRNGQVVTIKKINADGTFEYE